MPKKRPSRKKDDEAAAQQELDELLRHLVCLAFLVRNKMIRAPAVPAKEAGVQFRSGFILEVNRQWYWLTAGHILEEIERDGLKHPTQVAETFRLISEYKASKTPKDFAFLPFRYEEAWKHYEHDDDTGIDYGIVALGPLEKKALKKDNVTPIASAIWKALPNLKLPFFFLLGFPSSEIKPVYTDTKDGFSVTAKPVATAISMKMLAKVDKTKPYRLFAKVPKKAGQLKGFSGGPCFVVTDKGYEIMALQSGWNPSTRIAFVCPLGLIGPNIMKAIRKRPK